MNAEKSVTGENAPRRIAAKMTVVQKSDTLSIERIIKRDTGEETSSTEKLTMDGKECVSTVMGRPRTSTATWSEDGKSLTIVSKSVFERDGNKIEISSTETWKLSEDGKSLTVDVATKSPRGERKGAFIYDKAK
jgi:Tol biopolymer transport system component